MPEPTVRPTRYEVTCLPEDDINAPHFALEVAYRGSGLWAVTRHGACLSADGSWDWEPSPSNREDDWLERHRFDLDTALRLAREAAPRITVNGHTVTDALALADQRRQEERGHHPTPDPQPAAPPVLPRPGGEACLISPTWRTP
jgi:hypothetical protein